MKVKAIKTAKIELNQLSLIDFLDRYVTELAEKSVVAITSKIVSLCEGRAVKIGELPKNELVQAEADYYLDTTENAGHQFFLTIKNDILIQVAGIDESNTNGWYVLWPKDPQKSVNQAREFLAQKFGLKEVGVIMTDSKTTPLRWGVTGVGMAGSGFLALNDYRGTQDLFGRTLKVSQSSVLDALAATAVLAMGEGDEARPLVIMSELAEMGVQFTGRDSSAEELAALHITPEIDIFGQILTGVKWHKGGGGWQKVPVENEALKNYLEKEIVPRYNEADKGHNWPHINRVIKYAQELNEVLGRPVTNDLLVTAVIFHDLGAIGEVREGHNERSAQILRNDLKLAKFFTPDEIQKMAVACYEHRASYSEERTDILSKIVADADTIDSINFERIIIYYRDVYPEDSADETVARMWAHYRKKHYPKTGTAHFSLPEAEEMIKPWRDLLWSMIDDEQKFCDYIWTNYRPMLEV